MPKPSKPDRDYETQGPDVLKIDAETRTILYNLCLKNASLANQVIYAVKKKYNAYNPKIDGKKDKPYRYSVFDAFAEFQSEANFTSQSSDMARQTIRTVIESAIRTKTGYYPQTWGWKQNHHKTPEEVAAMSEMERKLYFKFHPRLHYHKNRDKDRTLKPITISVTTAGFKYLPDTHQVRISLGNQAKKQGTGYVFIPAPSNLERDGRINYLRMIKFIPQPGLDYQIEVCWCYTVEPAPKSNLNPDNWIALDWGVNNLLTAVSNTTLNIKDTLQQSFIIEGRQLKSMNRWYNQEIARLKTGQPQGFWSKKLARITAKRNRQVKHQCYTAARRIIDYCLANNIGTLVFGWSQGCKNKIKTGKRNNQNIVQIPHAKIRNRLKYLSERFGIEYIITEESYTSKASFLDQDVLPVFGNKPPGWKKSGTRSRRGLYKPKNLTLKINADCNAAANIARKGLKVKVDESKIFEAIEAHHLAAPVRVRI